MQTNNTNQDYGARLTPEGIIAFQIDEKTSLYNPNIQYFQDHQGNPYLVVNNKIGNRLIFFDFITKVTAFEVKFKEEGKNGIGQLRGATVLSLDSIILLGTGHKNIYLADTSGTIIRKYPVKPKNNNERIPQIHYSITNYFLPTHEDIYIFSMPYGLGWPGEEEALQKPTLLRYNLRSEEWEYINITYPEVYRQKGHYTLTHFEGDIARHDNKLIINFPASNYLHVYEAGRLTRHLAKSDKVHSIPPPGKKLATTSEEIDVQILQSPTYFFVSYDTYRKVYYRFLLHAQEDLSSMGDILRMYDEKPCSIIILDETFNKIGETDLAPNTYHIPDHFIAPEGLYISANHPDNPRVDEDKLTYQLLKLQYENK